MKHDSIHWEALGRIFDPSEHILYHGPGNYAQGPQAVVLDDFVRIFFSTRIEDEPGQFYSYVSYADFTRDLSELIRVASHELLPRSSLGEFDEHGIFPLNVLQLEDEILGFPTGWSRRKSVAADSSIGLVVSKDSGESFQRRFTGPILSSILREPFLVADGCVLETASGYIMYYIYGQEWVHERGMDKPERVYKISYATSSDLEIWERKSELIIPTVLGDEECQAFPTVFEHHGEFHMIFCFRSCRDFRTNPEKAYRLGHAVSRDLIHWTRVETGEQGVLDRSEWDSEMQCYPHVFSVDQSKYLLYNGNEFGKFGFGLARMT